MDKLKTRVLFISLIILALVSISAVAAADDADIISANQDDFDLSEETVSDIVEVSDDSQDDTVLSAVPSDSSDDETQLKANEDGSSTVTFTFEILTSNGPKNVTNVQKISKGGTKAYQQGWFDNAIRNYQTVTYQGKTYSFDHWENETGDIISEGATINKPYQRYSATGEDYTVLFKAIYVGPCTITVNFNGIMDINGNEVEDMIEQQNITSGTTWTINYVPFANKIEDYLTYDKDGYHYTFSHWEDEQGNIIPEDYSKDLTYQSEDYTLNYYAKYDKELIGNFTLIYNDALGHGSGSWNSTQQYGVNFTHTFITPADIPSGAKFLYWERNDTKEQFNVGDEYNIDYSEFAGKTVVVYVNAVYDINTTVELKEITDYVEEVIDIVADIKSDVFKVANPNGGTATLTIDYGNGNTYTQTVDVENGKATFKDVPLENPGDFDYKVEYSGFSYNQHSEGINDYLPSNAESKLHVLPLNTTVSNASETGKPGDKVHVDFTVTDQNGHDVANGTLTVTVDGTTYTTEVSGGKAAFDIVLPNPGNYSFDVNYEGNNYYNPSVGQLNLTVQKVDVIVTLPEVIDYTGAVVDIVVDVVDEFGKLVNEGTVTLTIDWGTKLSDKLMAAAETHTVEVSNGKATFKGITLGAPGTYPSKAEYSGTDYYNEAENESDVIVKPLDTTTSGEDVSGKPGEKKDITADIVDQNGNPVKNGTAVLKVNGKEYTAEVKDGKATFKGVELPDESTEATIDYLGNDYYNPSSTTIQITVTQPEEPDNETDEPTDEPTAPTVEKSVPVMPAAGNPIALVVLALLTLVSTVSLGRKK
jgi:hypothetical protein